MYASPVAAESHIQSGKLKVLGISGTRRHPGLPGVATFTEQGIPEADGSILWFGLLTAAKTPQPVVEKLNSGVNKVLQLPDLRQRYEQAGVEIGGGAPEALAARMKNDVDRLGPLVKAGALNVE